MNLENIIGDMKEKGSTFDEFPGIEAEAKELIENNDYSDIINELVNRIISDTKKFLEGRNESSTKYISGVSSCIYIPSLNSIKVKVMGGDKSRYESIKINENTLFDVASVTKLFTLLLLYRLENLGLINLDSKISDLNPDLNLEDFTFNDLIKLYGEIYTDGNIRLAKDKEEAYKILKTMYLKSNSRDTAIYTDFGAIAISDTLEKIFNMDFDSIMKEYLLKPLGLLDTTFNPTTLNVSGNNGNKYPHDPKARILGGAVGSAGIFTTNDDLCRLADSMYTVTYVDKEFFKKHQIKKIGTANIRGKVKGDMGVYVKHPEGLEKTFTSNAFSDNSFSHQGWTGALAVFDSNLKIHQNILVNAVYEGNDSKNDKPVGYLDAFTEYQLSITRNTILMYLASEYFDKVKHIENENIDMVIKV